MPQGEIAALKVGRLDLLRRRIEFAEAVSAPRGELVLSTPDSHSSWTAGHCAANLAVSSDANVKAVHRILGHASTTMTLDVQVHQSRSTTAWLLL